MALSNRERVDRALHILATALGAFVEREMDAHVGSSWRKWVDHDLERRLERRADGSIDWEVQPLLKVMFKNWNDVFKKTLGHAERSLVSELLEVRNRWAHQKAFSYDDAHRALDSVERLLQATSAPRAAQEINAMRQEVLRTMFVEQRRTVEKRQQPTLTLESTHRAGLKPWRHVITPHADVSSGRYSEAEFAADLAQVHRGGAAAEYGDPAEFFRRTFLTKGLRTLLEGAIRRLSAKGGDPVVELQTNFGGGKTHSMLALYHLTGAADPAALAGIDQMMADLGVSRLPKVNRAVLVGTALSPAQAVDHGDVVANTLWGEMAWQLGGEGAYKIVAASDRDRAAPGSDVLTDLLKRTAPCLILIDEWVAFARQLYTNPNLPAGSFDANLTFAQALTEAIKAVPGALLVASLPASQIEIGGEGGALALDRLKNTFGRLESSWRPATAEEGFEIVRRRLFEPMTERESFAARDAVVKAYGDAYREGGAAYPSECGEAAYRRRMEAAYPIHPEVFERLNNDWGALDKFQKTRGVLRLMAGVINVLWEQNDQGLTIMPGFLPLDDARVEVEMTRYLEHRWDAIIATDIDGENAHAVAVDRENPNLQRFSATRRIARALFLASAPSVAGRNPGIDDRRVRLGTVQPGEAVGIFGDALRRLADRATYLYVDGSRYWFSVQPTVTRLADDRAAGVEPEAIEAAIVERLERERRESRPFTGMHVAPADSADVGDEPGVRLVVLAPRHTYAATGESEAKAAAERILKTKGGAPRTYQNTLLFAAPDRRRLGELQEAVRTWLAWRSIVDEAESLDLTPFQQSQARSKRADWERTVESRVRETWCWAMAPHQPHPLKPELEWDVNRIGGQEGLAARAGKRFEGDEAMLTQLGARRLLQEMDRFDLWEGHDHVNLKKLAGFFAGYLYLPRLRDRRLLAEAVRSAIGQLVPGPFAYAEGFDDADSRYESLHVTSAGSVPIVFDDASVLVKAEAANEGNGKLPPPPPPPLKQQQIAKRFFGSIDLNPDRLGRDAVSIADEVLIQLNALPGANVRVTLEIEATHPNGFGETVRRVVEENCRTLKFKDGKFERE